MNQPIPFGAGRPADADADRNDLTDVMRQVAHGDKQAFATLYDAIAPLVFGIVLKVVRDRAQSEEVAQEVMIDLWRQAARYRPGAGSVRTWAATIAHRRAVDRVRSAQAAADREHAQAAREHTTAFDEVAEEVETRLESEQVRRCLRGLTELQRQAVNLAYYGGLTYREVAEALRTPLPTIKTRMRDGLVRLRDCMGVTT
ncbi:ECF RNA polymerase sigma factor SigK [Streptomyces sp. NPDC003860]